MPFEFRVASIPDLLKLSTIATYQALSSFQKTRSRRPIRLVEGVCLILTGAVAATLCAAACFSTRLFAGFGSRLSVCWFAVEATAAAESPMAVSSKEGGERLLQHGQSLSNWYFPSTGEYNSADTYWGTDGR